VQLSTWHHIVSAASHVRSQAEGTIIGGEAPSLDSVRTVVMAMTQSSLETLRREINTSIDRLQATLNAELTENEVHQILLPLVIHCDELVLRRLPPKDRPTWRMLQNERYKIDDGGDVFYQLIEERLLKADTPVLTFEVLYFCLRDGFVGRFESDPSKIATYMARLAARIPMPALPAPLKKKKKRPEGAAKKLRDGARDRPAAGVAVAPLRAVPPVALYLGTALLLFVIPLLLIWVSNW
jgi:type VI protein secretion system component VasF